MAGPFAASQPMVAVLESVKTDGFFASSLQLAGFEKLSPLASTFLLLRQKKGTKEKATPDRSKARNKINDLRRWGNSVPGRHTTSVGGLKHSPA